MPPPSGCQHSPCFSIRRRTASSLPSSAKPMSSRPTRRSGRRRCYRRSLSPPQPAALSPSPVPGPRSPSTPSPSVCRVFSSSDCRYPSELSASLADRYKTSARVCGPSARAGSCPPSPSSRRSPRCPRARRQRCWSSSPNGLHVGAGRFGLLLGAIGVGAGLGPMVLQRLVRDVRRRGWLFGPYLLRGAVDLALATSASFPLALGALATYGAGTSTGNITYNSVLQTTVPDRLPRQSLCLLRRRLAKRTPCQHRDWRDPRRPTRHHRRVPPGRRAARPRRATRLYAGGQSKFAGCAIGGLTTRSRATGGANAQEAGPPRQATATPGQ